ncbi:hypothetical protein CEK29_19940 [Bordetella genomosp. 5]|nr:hypothetical protein CEK29_19940 [Bordetella genomosp. 5]
MGGGSSGRYQRPFQGRASIPASRQIIVKKCPHAAPSACCPPRGRFLSWGGPRQKKTARRINGGPRADRALFAPGQGEDGFSGPGLRARRP